MEPQVAEYIAGVVALAQATFEQVEYSVDATPARAILRLRAGYSSYQIFITELFSEETRQYRYYVLQGDWVEAGFDNSPDPRAIRLKYGRIGQKHAGESVPHLHRVNKTERNYSAMSFRPKGEISEADAARWRFLGLRPRNDMRAE